MSLVESPRSWKCLSYGCVFPFAISPNQLQTGGQFGSLSERLIKESVTMIESLLNTRKTLLISTIVAVAALVFSQKGWAQG